MDQNKPSTLGVMTCNIRFENPHDGENDWPCRKDFVAEIINGRSPDLFGTQEGLQGQLLSLGELLPNYEMIADHRDWISNRMYPTLFLKKGRFKVIKSEDIWLSETPDVAGSKSFDSAFPRLCTYVELEDLKEDNEKIVFIDCHLDHVLESTREKQISVLCEEILKRYPVDSNFILIGDFNSPPHESVRTKLNEYIKDILDPWKELGLPEECTFHKFDGIDPIGDNSRIDWTLHGPKFKAIKTESVKDTLEGRYPSDHFFIHTILSY
ncbi:MAG: endonuclease/exonuclease/phosphatase family protein [Halobacteriovoraceae bacterium]|nr:endonuclease/exonuclease/phosphatase family protein [Halobacteriovoraceae bacterium]